MVRNLRDWFAKRKFKPRDVQVKARRMANVAEGLETYATAAAVAQEGHLDYAQDLIRRGIHEWPKVLLVGGADGFSPQLVDYTVSLARRMGCEIVALSCVPSQLAIGEGGGASWEEQAIRWGEPLMARAAEEMVPCRQVVRFGAPDQCVKGLLQEMRRVEFVLAEPRAESGLGIEVEIPVFCLVGSSER
ncbi:MAG: hypothetical protein ACUVXD_01900 [Thermodesulfobacteriota bacterium]